MSNLSLVGDGAGLVAAPENPIAWAKVGASLAKLFGVGGSGVYVKNSGYAFSGTLTKNGIEAPQFATLLDTGAQEGWQSHAQDEGILKPIIDAIGNAFSRVGDKKIPLYVEAPLSVPALRSSIANQVGSKLDEIEAPIPDAPTATADVVAAADAPYKNTPYAGPVAKAAPGVTPGAALAVVGVGGALAYFLVN